MNVATANNSNVTLGAGADKLNITGVTSVGTVTITDFALGTGGDVLSVTTGAAATFGGVGAAAVIGQLVVLNTALASDAAIVTAVEGIANGAGKASVIVINNTTGVAELWHDSDTNTDDGAPPIPKVAPFENINTEDVLTDATTGFVAANFGTWA